MAAGSGTVAATNPVTVTQQGILQALGLGLVRSVLTFGASVAVDLTLGSYFYLDATTNAAFAIANPSGPIPAGRLVLIQVHNSSGGAMAAGTFGTVWNPQTTVVQPATGTDRFMLFISDGTNLWEIVRSAADAS